MRSDAEAYGHARQEIRRETLARADKLRQQRRRVLLDRTGLCLRVTLKEAPQERAFCKQITRAGRHNGRPARPDLFKVGGQVRIEARSPIAREEPRITVLIGFRLTAKAQGLQKVPGVKLGGARVFEIQKFRPAPVSAAPNSRSRASATGRR